jgi:hypothetical protein
MRRDALLRLLVGAQVRLALSGSTDRGDVPGWVMITLMTAGLVVLLTGLASAAFGNLFARAVQSVCPSC